MSSKRILKFARFCFSLLFIFFSFSAYAKIDQTYKENVEEKVQKGIRVDEFQNLISLNENIVDRRREIEVFLNKAEGMPEYQASVLSALQQEKYNRADILNRDIAISITRDKKFNANNSEFKYLPHSDGSVIYFKAGRTSRILNERVVDEFGNLSLKDTWNMKYNNRLMLTSYESKTADDLGNITTASWQGTYTDDSVWYGTDDTSANKNMLTYTINETDHAGNTRSTNWEALEYAGKLVKKLKSEITDSVYGTTSYTRSDIKYTDSKKEQISSYIEEGYTNQNLFYTAKRENISYTKKDQISGYQEEKIIYSEDGSVRETINTKASFSYLHVPMQFGPDMADDPDPDKLLYSNIQTETVKGNGETKKENNTTDYVYNAKGDLVDASARSEFTGNKANWCEYTDQNGNILAREENQDKSASYYFSDENGQKIFVAEDQVVSEVKSGNKFQGSSQTDFEVLYGMPMVSEVNSTTYFYGKNISEDELINVEASSVSYTNGLKNNFRKLLGTKEHTEISDPLKDPDNAHLCTRDINTDYLYDDKGSLSQVTGSGTAAGFEYSSTQGWHGQYTSTISIDYEIFLGNPAQVNYYELKKYHGGEE